MAKIKVKLDIPDGEYCINNKDLCRKISCRKSAARCIIFDKQLNIHSLYVFKKCQECIDATVKEK